MQLQLVSEIRQGQWQQQQKQTQKNHKNHKKSRKIYYNKVKNLVLIFSQGKVAACHLLEESFARIVDS